MSDFTYLSFGAGVQSTAVLVMSNLGLRGCPRADVAIFADTGDEPQWVYEQVDRMTKWSDIPVEVVSTGCLSDDVRARQTGSISRFACISVFTAAARGDGKNAILRRQCTREYKIEPIEKRVRALLGYKPRQRIKESVECCIGISLDEVTRIKPSRTRWITNRWPLVDAGMRRHDCQRIIEEQGLPQPRKSSCVFCPYHSDAFWRDLKENHSGEFDKAVEFDVDIRSMSRSGMRQPVFLHRSLVPLDEVDLTDPHKDQVDMFANECEGYCAT